MIDAAPWRTLSFSKKSHATKNRHHGRESTPGRDGPAAEAGLSGISVMPTNKDAGSAKRARACSTPGLIGIEGIALASK